jgi:hypothetical protein
MKLKNVSSLGFYPPRRYWPRVPEMVWDVTCNWAYKKTKTWIEEPLSLLDSWHRISYRDTPSLLGPMPQKLLYSSILRTRVFSVRSNATFGLRGPIYETMPQERMDNVVTYSMPKKIVASHRNSKMFLC